MFRKSERDGWGRISDHFSPFRNTADDVIESYVKHPGAEFMVQVVLMSLHRIGAENMANNSNGYLYPTRFKS